MVRRSDNPDRYATHRQLLLARQLPAGGRTSWNNQYLAYETLPDDIKSGISGRYSKHDSSRNSAGRLRVGFQKPETLADVPAQIIRWLYRARWQAGALSRASPGLSVAIHH